MVASQFRQPMVYPSLPWYSLPVYYTFKKLSLLSLILKGDAVVSLLFRTLLSSHPPLSSSGVMFTYVS